MLTYYTLFEKGMLVDIMRRYTGKFLDAMMLLGSEFHRLEVKRIQDGTKDS